MNINLLDFIKSNYPKIILNDEQISLIKDIEDHKMQFERHFMDMTINVIIDQHIYKKHESVKNYSILNGLSVILILVSIICIFFSWKIALGILLFSFFIKKYAKTVLRKGGKELVVTFHNIFLVGEYNEALTMLFYMFGTGQIALQTQSGTSVAPQMPSECL